MPCLRRGSVNTAPPHQLGPPGYVGVLAVGEEIGIEEASVHRDVVDHPAAVEGRRRASAEDILLLVELGSVGLMPAPVKMAQRRSEVDAGGIDQAARQGLKPG